MFNKYTSLGLLSIFFWSSSVALVKSLSIKLGVVYPAFLVYLFGALFLTSLDYYKNKRLRFLKFSKTYLAICGFFFVTCMITFYLAVGLTSSKDASIGIGLVNYTWPSLTILLSIPILLKKAKPLLFLGLTLASVGVVFAICSTKDISYLNFLKSLKTDTKAYIFAMLTAISWALYSNLTIKLGKDIDGDAVSLFMFLTAICLLPFAITSNNLKIDFITLIELFVLSITNTLGYLFWDVSMRRGNMIAISSFAYFIPLFSTICTAYYFDLNINTSIIYACLLIISGAFICKNSIISDN